MLGRLWAWLQRLDGWWERQAKAERKRSAQAWADRQRADFLRSVDAMGYDVSRYRPPPGPTAS